MSQALELVERLRVEWLVYELGSLEQRKRARETARELLRLALWRETSSRDGGVDLRVIRWCEDGSAFCMKGHRDGMKPIAGAELVLSGVWGPYDASDEHLAAWVLGLEKLSRG